jgi:TP901 family phage tail tape measure protein
MADVQSNIHVNIDTSDALASLKLLQRQISAFHTQMSKSGTAASAVAANQAQNLMNSINATGKFQASMRSVATSTEQFTNALEKNKLSSREYFRYTGAATKTFGRLFRSEFETINKVARERVKDLQTQYIKMGRGANGALQAIAVRPLTLDMQNLGTQTAMAAQKQQILNQLLKQGSTNLLNFGKNTQWAGRQLMVGFTVPLVMLGTTAAKTFMKLEEQAIRFKRVYGDMFTTKEQTDRMVQDIQQLAREYTKYGVAVEETMKMAADAAAMGKVGADLTAQVAQATRLAVLGGVEQSQALETTISITNAFGTATEDLAKKINFLNAVENQTIVSIEDLTIAIPKAGPVVQQLGGDVEDLAFFLTAMKEGGINASEGANALKSGLASLINPSEKASKMLMGLGVNIKGIVEANAGDVKSTVIDFAKALDTLDPLNRARAIEQLFGKFQFSRLSTLFQNVVAEGSQASKVLGLAKATTEQLAILSERELAKIEDTTTYKFKKAIEDLKVTLAPVGEQFLKALTPIVEFVAKILDKFNDLGDGSKRFITILTVALGAVGPVALMAFGLLANGVANIIKMFASLRSVFTRAGSSTQILGQQTDYLTQQQIEASAVAASLDQVHQKLRQTFTSEATAVNTLASAYKRAIAAQAGFTGPAGKAPGGKGLKKYSRGTPSVPGTGNQDTVPTMLTPGEAVIPAQAAQDPANRPVIARMIAGETVQGFNTGSGNVQPVGSEKMAFAHAAAPIKYNNLNDIPDEFSDKRTGYQARGIAQATGYTGIGFDIPASMNYELKAKNAAVDVRAYEAAIKNPESIKTMTARLMGPPLQLSASEALRVSSEIRSNLLSSLAILPDGTKINDDLVYRRIGSIRKGILGGLARDPKNKTIIQRMLDPHGIGIGSKSVVEYDKDPATPRELLEAQKKATNAEKLIPATERLVKYHPDAVVQVRRDANGNIIAYKKPEVSRSNPTSKPTKFNNGALLADGSFSAGRAGGESGGVSIKADSKSTKAALKAIQSVDGITEYGKKDTDIKDVGRSNPKHRHITGVYDTADGKGKVFVKPMINLQNALAEQRAATILRDAHNLEVPEQRITMVKDPITKRLVYALESVFDPKFAGKNMPVTFSDDDYFKQLLASALRGDKDLGRGNLGGKMAPDVGTAYIYDVATQYDTKTGKERVISDAVKSVGHQALINVGGVKGSGAKQFFADATRDIALSMDADEYQRRMIAEIDRVIPQLDATIKKFGLTGDEAKPYNAIIERLKEARNNVDWTKIHTAHTTAGKVAITPEELILNNKTKKTRKPKKEKLPKTVKSSGGPGDTVMTNAPGKNEQVVKPGKPPRRVGKVTIPGFADAPRLVSEGGSTSSVATAVVDGARGSIAQAKNAGADIGKTISQSAALASKNALYGTGPIDAEAKSLRRQIEKRQRIEARTQAKAAASKKALYGDGEIDAIAKSKRRNAQKRSRLEQNVGMPGSVITAGTADSAERQTLSSRLKSRFGAKYDEDGNKVPRKVTRAGVTGGAMAASGAAMMASMIPGQIGETAQKIMMPLMGLTMILPLLSSTMGIAVVAFGALAGSIYYFNQSMKKARQAGIDLAKSMTMTSEKLQSLSEVTGTVSATEEADRKRQNTLTGAGGVQRKFGENILGSEFGKTLLGDIEKQAEAGLDTEQIADNISSSLSYAVMQGVITSDQALSISSALGEELRSYEIPALVSGSLVSLFGPNGENLVKDPLKISLEIQKQSMDKQAILFQNALDGMKPTTGLSAWQTIAATTGTAATLGGAAGLAGGPFAPFTATAGAVAGGVAGLIGGTGAAIADQKNKESNNKLGAAAIQMALENVTLNNGLVDSINKQYDSKVALAKTEKEIKTIEEERAAALKTINANNATALNFLVQQKDAFGPDVFTSGINAAIDELYKEGPMKVFATQAKEAIKGVTDEDFKAMLQIEFASGSLDAATVIKLANNKQIQKSFKLVVESEGSAKANMLLQLLMKAGIKDQNIPIFMDIINQDPETFDKNMEAIAILADMKQKYGTSLDINTNGKAKLDAVVKSLDQLKGINNKEISKTAFTKILKDDPVAYDELMANWKTLVGTSDTITKTVYFDFIAARNDNNIVKEYMAAMGITPLKGRGFAGQVKAYRDKAAAWKVGGQGKPKEDPCPKGQKMNSAGMCVSSTPTKTEKEAIPASPLDNLVKRLRDVRKNQIGITQGWIASSAALKKLFGGKKTVGVFSGIENDLRKIGAGENLIDLITGMSKEEYEREKGRLFEFDADGNIIKLKDDAQTIQDALDSVKLGEFVSDQEKMAKQIGNQVTALNRLRAAGIEGSVALEAVADATFAASIANKNLDDTQIKNIAAAWKIATAEKRNYAAIDALTNEETGLDREIEILKKLTELMGQFTKEQLDAIMASSALRAALIDLASFKPGDAGFEQFLRVLRKTLEKEKIQLNLDKNTIEGMQKIFDQGFATAMERVDVAEKKLTLQFDVDTEGFQNKIDKAQDQIDDAEYEKDDKEAALRAIEKQEEKINEKYDERIKALDEVEKANAAISAQQKGQLSLAEALTSGDIAAAARAAQDMRAQAAADAVTKERDVLEKSRERELSKVTEGGKTRKQLETRIKELEDTIFNLEENEIEPNQDNIRKKNVDLREQVKELDKVRRTWEQYQNAIDEARVNNKVADKAIADALEVMPRLKEAYRTQCPPGFMWDEGIKDCIPIPEPDPIIPAGTPECPPGTTDDGSGNCVPTAVADPGGTTPCVANAGMGCGWNMNGLIQCDGTCEGGEDPGKIKTVKTCPKGQEKNAQGNCVPIKKAEVTKKEGVAKTCAAGETLVGGKCVKKPTLDELRKKDPMWNSSALHREELARIAADNKKNQMLFQQNMNVRDVAKNAGNTPAQHLQQFYKMQNDLAVQKAMAPTPGMLAQEKAVKEAAARAAKAAADKKAKDAANLKNFGGNAAAANAFGNWPIKKSMGGLIPKYFERGGFTGLGGAGALKFTMGSFARGTDTVPAMLTPGEFIMSKYAVEAHGVNTMRAINNGESTGGTVYNNTYTLTVNAKTDANPKDIAQAVMSTIKRVDDRRIRGVSLNG